MKKGHDQKHSGEQLKRNAKRGSQRLPLFENNRL